jgi:hypothetical protein
MSLGTSGEYIDGNLRSGKKLCVRKEDKYIDGNYVSGKRIIYLWGLVYWNVLTGLCVGKEGKYI